MDNYWLIEELGKVRHQEFMRDADRARRFLTSKKRRRLSVFLQAVMLIFG